MKWEDDLDKIYKPGERRLRYRFAWRKTKLSDGYSVWLESYWENQLFVDKKGGGQWVVESTEAIGKRRGVY
jgi:hypothetical protein